MKIAKKLISLSLIMFSLMLFNCFKVNANAATTNADWNVLTGDLDVSAEDSEGFVTLSGINSKTVGANRVNYAYKVKLDGATISFKDENSLSNADFFGFLLTNDYNSSFPTSLDTSGFVVSARKGFNGGSSVESEQTRMGICSGYTISNSTGLTYCTYDSMVNGGTTSFGGSGSLITNNIAEWGVSVKFTFVEDSTIKTGETGYWKIEIKQLYSGMFWNSSYNHGYDGVDTVTQYMWNSTIASKLDENGNTYVVAYGTDESVDESKLPTPKFSIEDDNERNYSTNREQLVQNASNAVSTFKNAISDNLTYVKYMALEELKETAVNAVSLLRGEDLPQYQALLNTELERFSNLSIPSMKDSEWIAVGETTLDATYNPRSKTSNLGGLEEWGKRAYYSSKIHLDGATITLRDQGTTEDGDYWGFVLSTSEEGYFQDSRSQFAGVFRKGLYSSGTQTRFNIGPDHDFSKASYAWPTTDYTLGKYGYNFGPATSLVLTDADNYGLSITFKYVEDTSNIEGGYWELTIKALYTGSMWTNSANYNAADMSATVYVRPSVMNQVLDINGDTYVIALGDGKIGTRLEYGITDSNYNEYAQTKLDPVIEKINEYKEATKTSTGETFADLLALREELLAEVATLRGNDASLQTMYIQEYDTYVSTNTAIQEYLVDTLGADFKKATDIIATFSTESNITANNITLAEGYYKEAMTKYNGFVQMLSATNVEYFTNIQDDIKYNLNLATSKLWLINYETKVSALSSLSGEQLITALIELNELYLSYSDSDAYDIVTTILNSADKAAYEARLDEAYADYSEIYSNNETSVKETYLAGFESKLEEDLTNKNNLDSAYNAYVTLNTYVTITEADTTLYQRYVAAYDKFVAACELYITTIVGNIDTNLSTKDYTKIEDFAEVKNAYLGIDKTYLGYCSDEVKDLYADITVDVTTHNLYYFNTTNVDGSVYFENTDSGMYFEYKPVWGNRLNYDRLLDLTKGVSVDIRFDEYASLLTGHSNNVFLNFLPAPNTFKGGVDGLTLILWLSDASGTSYLRVYNYTDSEIAYVAFKTPVEGGTLNVSVKYGSYTDYDGSEYDAYVIEINNGEAKLVLTEQQLTANGHTMSNDVYFSLGGVCNDATNVNGFTLLSITEGDTVTDFKLKELAPDVDYDYDADYEKPVINLIMPETIDQRKEVEINYTVSDNVTSNENLDVLVEVKKGSTAVEVVDNKFAGLPGSYTITITATDEAGNSSTASTTVIIIADTTDPVITITTPPTAYVGDVIEVKYSVSDDATPEANIITQVEVKKGDDVVEVVDGKFTAEAATYTITVTAKDEAGNEVTKSLTITVTEAPIQGEPQGCGGCGGSLIGSVFGLIVIMGAIIILKKKDEENE